MIENLALGIGNRLLMDDGIGVYIVEKLKEKNENRNGSIKYAIGETDIDYCMDEIENANYVVIIDALYAGNTPGSITIFPLDHMNIHINSAFFSHDAHLLNKISSLKPDLKGLFIGIEPLEIKYGIGLSDKLSLKLPELVKKIEGILAVSIKSNLIS